MITNYSLFQLLKKYGIEPLNILECKRDKILNYGEYAQIEEVLKFLKDKLISSSSIEKCPSILYFNLDNIKGNYEFLCGNSFNNYVIGDCLHVLGTDKTCLKETYE